MEYTNMSFLYDFAFMSLLLIIAQFLRSRIKFLQMFYIPASVLAGLMGLGNSEKKADAFVCAGQLVELAVEYGFEGNLWHCFLALCLAGCKVSISKSNNALKMR